MTADTARGIIIQAINCKPSQELVSELKNRPGIAFINATDSAEVTLKKACAAIDRVKKGTRQSS